MCGHFLVFPIYVIALGCACLYCLVSKRGKEKNQWEDKNRLPAGEGEAGNNGGVLRSAVNLNGFPLCDTSFFS